ncbi:MAG: hypothetical protein GYB26_12310 [Gammaproteobacteria bacterium]|nr:hypothetical protein [Gammaproteobacteria bacterium]
MEEDDWKSERVGAIQESLEFLSTNEQKFEREKWVVARLLEHVVGDFSESLLSEAEEPADVTFHEANFQVKEILEDGRRRGDEYRKALSIAKKAEDFSDLISDYDPKFISFSDIVARSHTYAEGLVSKYGPLEREKMDLVCYFNFNHHHETPPEKPIDFPHLFRSFSIVSNRYRAVIYATDDAPAFMRESEGKVWDITGDQITL